MTIMVIRCKKDISMKEDEGLTLAPKLREGVYGILIRDNSVLMSNTKSGNRIIINFPGGAVDPGENHNDALIREFEEESGDTIEVVRHLFSSDGSYINPDYPDNRLQCHYYLVQAHEPLRLQGIAADVSHVEWFLLADLPYNRMLEVDADFCKWLPQLLASERVE